MQKEGYFYILSSKKYGTLYCGVTSDIRKRSWEHKEGFVDGFTKKYKVKMLVYYEIYPHIVDAIKREKAVKKWYRQWKINLINEFNPEWKDLYYEL